MILKVTCDKETFKEVAFTEGLNIVLADRAVESSAKDSRNSLGKTTLIEIIHFCLGGSATKSRLLAKPIEDWTFTLELLLGGKKVKVSRNTNHVNETDPVTIIGDTTDWPISPELNETTNTYELKLRDWKKTLGLLMFGLPIEEQIPKYRPSFRGVVSYLIRRRHDAYSNPFEHHRKQGIFDTQVFMTFLLGLDWEYAREKAVLHDREELNDALRKAAKTGILGGEVGNLGELRAMKVVLEKKVKEQADSLNTFKVHKDYKEIQKDANTLTKKMHKLENLNIADGKLLTLYEQSIREEKPPDPEEVLSTYKEAGVVLSDNVKRRLEEVKIFHQKLIKNRRDFLKSEIERLNDNIENRRKEVAQMSLEKAGVMEVLRKHGALEEYNLLQRKHLKTVEQLNYVKRGMENLVKYREGKNKIDKEKRDLVARADRDLQERQTIVEKAMSFFSANSGFLYNNPGYFTIDVNDDINRKTFYRFDAQIKGAADEGGVAQMSVFCFDLMLAQLWSEREPTPGFLIHDSIIFADVDERQIANALVLVERESRVRNFQYILTLNSDNIPTTFLPPDFDIEKFVRLKLTDAKPEGSLLGIRFHSGEHQID